MSAIDQEHEFGALETEWCRIQDLQRYTASSAWTQAVNAMTDEERCVRADGQWVKGAADVFGVLGISRSEVRHTKFIAWLMDPAARHGLGIRFLARVLSRVFPGERFDNLGSAEPVCEVTRGPCRADIVVYASDFRLVIEAKVDADESNRQCDEQFAVFSGDIGSRFIFLTPHGRLPHSATADAKEAFRPLSFAAIRDDLRAALAEATHGRGRCAAEDYLRTLEREFPWPS